MKKIRNYSPDSSSRAARSAARAPLAMTAQTVTKILVLLLLLHLHQAGFAATKKPLIVVLDWFINPNHAPLIITQQLGLFQQQGLEVKFIPPADTAAGEKMVVAGKADIAVTYHPALVYKATQGLPLIRFATLINAPLSCLIALDNKAIQHPKDLKHKKIGVSTHNTESMILAAMLQQVNLSIKDITPINVKFNLTQSLLSHNIDAFSGGMRNFEPNMIKLAGQTAKVFYPEQYGFPKYDELILVTHKNNSHNPDLGKFTQALQQGTNYLINHPEACWQIFARLYPELNNQLNREAWFFTLPYFARHPGLLDHNRYQRLAKFMYQAKLIPRWPALSEYAINTQF